MQDLAEETDGIVQVLDDVRGNDQIETVVVEGNAVLVQIALTKVKPIGNAVFRF